MSVKVIQQRLASYRCRTGVDEQRAIREISQEVVLAALGRSDFFKHALLQGGSCLRIFHGLNRFSEDLDFILRKPDVAFELQQYLRHVSDELTAYGYDIEITDRSKADAAVKMAFLKDASLGKVLSLRHTDRTGLAAKIRIKLEVDTNPPSGSTEGLQYLDFPFVSAVAVQDKPSLFAGKLHALLCREYVKGRDWYDFLWCTSQSVGVNFEFLAGAIQQLGPWQGKRITVDENWVLATLEERITSIDWREAAEDVRPFVPAEEQASLDLWSRELFLRQLRKLEQTVR